MIANLLGGHLADIPLPHRRYFDDKRRKRKVRVLFSRWMLHYHVSLTAEDDPIWNVATRQWQSAWDDHEGKGARESDRFNTLEEAVRWVERTMEKKFPGCVATRDYSDTRWSPERPWR